MFDSPVSALWNRGYRFVNAAMRLTTVRLENFRNHGETHLFLADGVNVFLGENGEGKTNILEAISYLCLTRSFFAGTDRIALQLGREQFSVSGTFLSDNELEFTVRVLYNATENRKRVWVNKKEPKTFSEVLGQFPVVALSPESGAITHGAPGERRKFIDIVIAQANKSYLEHLIEYRRCLKQRNKILHDAKIARRDPSEALEPWDISLVDHGTQIIIRRATFLQEFQQYVADAFQRLTKKQETPAMNYLGSVPANETSSREVIRETFLAQLHNRAAEERLAATTLTGPHRDDIALTINGIELRAFASQGQHKTFLVALKMAEFFYLKDRCRETPILLLDDILSELDEHRTQSVLNLTSQLGQTFITSTSERFFPEFTWGSSTRKFLVRRGTATPHEVLNDVG
jgi:DNA replication and repair protein RecF